MMSVFYTTNLKERQVACSKMLITSDRHQTPADTYRKTSSISRTKSQNLNVSCIPLHMSSLNPLKPGVKLRMKM